MNENFLKNKTNSNIQSIQSTTKQTPTPEVTTNIISKPTVTAPTYIKTPLILNTNNNSDTRYLQPQLTPPKTTTTTTTTPQTSYLEPTNKPVVKIIPPSLNTGYLQPTLNKTKIDDSYGGDDDYLPNNSSIKQDTYINEDYINELKTKATKATTTNINNRIAQIAEEEDDRIGESYLIPRIGSNTSRASSTAPLITKQRSGKNTYAPSPPLPNTKLSHFKSNNNNETNV